ncbi:MAG TPA: GDSL-type esterase/lipase family protein [Xanthomonadales bacterium]|nr:GDSL-type esterase/lipase family protein [Xanthomonadales bacterium]
MLAGLLIAGNVDAGQRIVIVGDSTASEYPAARYPRTGWGQVLGSYLAGEVEILNRAVSGRSTRDYRSLGHFDATMAQLRAGDLLLIQFGHNDAKREDPSRYSDAQTEFPAGLRQFIDAARALGATPVLLTPVARRAFDDAGRALDTHLEYAAAVRTVAAEEKVVLIDLSQRSMDWLDALGPEASKAYYLHDPVIGLVDDTHFHHRGAVAIACLVVADLVAQHLLAAAVTTRDVDCGVPTDQRERHADQALPSMIEHAESIAQVQFAPHGGDGITLASPFFDEAPEFGFAVRRRVLHQGASIGLHAHGKDEVYYVLSGRGELTLDGKAHAVVPGMAILTREGSSHSLRQVGSEDLAILIVYAQAPRARAP